MEAGAIGYLLKDVSADELALAIRAAHTGRATLSPDAAQALVQTANKATETDFDLTEREREVLLLMVEGLNNTQIAGQLGVSPSTNKISRQQCLIQIQRREPNRSRDSRF